MFRMVFCCSYCALPDILLLTSSFPTRRVSDLHVVRLRSGIWADRLAVPARLPEGPGADVPQTVERIAGHRLSHAAGDDRLRLRRPHRQGLHAGHPESPELPAGKAEIGRAHV